MQFIVLKLLRNGLTNPRLHVADIMAAVVAMLPEVELQGVKFKGVQHIWHVRQLKAFEIEWRATAH